MFVSVIGEIGVGIGCFGLVFVGLVCVCDSVDVKVDIVDVFYLGLIIVFC